MKKNITFFIFLFLVSFTFITAQTVSLNTYGISPRDAAVDTTDIFDRAYNGLLNVGIETKLYLKGSSDLPLSGSQTFEIVSKPDGSTVTDLNIDHVEDSNSVVAIFIPDVSGTYEIRFTDGGVSESIIINAGTFLGAEDANCLQCHSDKAATWADTRHASKLTRGVQGLVSSYYSEGCIGCHTVGYDANANNGGFDDWDFIFPDSLYIGADEDLAAAYPDAWKRANIQCESCHGPGSEHFGNKDDNRIAMTIAADNCALCHDAGTHHVFPEQWDQSGHSNPPTYPTGSGRSSCARCHTPEGFIEYVSGEEVTEHEWAPFSCAMCHDPHTNFGEDGLTSDRHQLRTTDATLSNGFEVVEGGTGKLCMNCHQSRRDADDYTKAQLTRSSSHFGPHYMTQADMFNATNVAAFGYNLPSSPHIAAIENSCIHCHMNEEKGKVDAEGNVTMVGMHTWAVEDLVSDEQNVEMCTPCHGEIESFDEKKYYDNNFVADHDGDGVEEGVHDEVEGLMEELAALLPHADSTAGYDAHDTVTPEFTVAEVKAAFNYEMVYYDRSKGIHNPAFTVALLKVSIEALMYGVITAGNIQSVTDIPMDQGFQVRLVWTKFGADDGVSPDQVKSYTVLRQVDDLVPGKSVTSYSTIQQVPVDISIGTTLMLDDTMWDIVAEVPAIQYGEYSAVVPTLYNTVEGDTVLTTFKVVGKTENGIIAETVPAAGYSTDDLAPATPTNLSAAVIATGVELMWDESADNDFNHFEIFRSETQGFEPTPEDLLATTTDIMYVDANIVEGTTYFYVVTAKDFSGNTSEKSNQVSATITDVVMDGGIPTEYALSQNYPNPFNPSTAIKFEIPEAGNVKLLIYDSVGNEVAVLVNNYMSAGYYTFTWNAANYASGIYFYKMQTNTFSQVNKMLLIK